MIRLNRFVAETSGLSRRAADVAISDGRVTLDGIVAEPTTQLREGQTVALDGEPLMPRTTYHYFLMHKPVGYICSRLQQGSTPTIYELLPKELHGLKSVGRLDRDTSGLLLLSDDGTFIHRQLHPSFNKDKTYQVELSVPLRHIDYNHLNTGVTLSDGMSYMKPQSMSGHLVTVTLTEGRNRQVRRTFRALGYRVISLHRTNFGRFRLGNLKPGAYRRLSPTEVRE